MFGFVQTEKTVNTIRSKLVFHCFGSMQLFFSLIHSVNKSLHTFKYQNCMFVNIIFDNINECRNNTNFLCKLMHFHKNCH